MKNTFKVLIIALIAILGLSLVSCESESTSEGGGGDPYQVTVNGLSSFNGMQVEFFAMVPDEPNFSKGHPVYAQSRTNLVENNTQTWDLYKSEDGYKKTDTPFRISGQYYIELVVYLYTGEGANRVSLGWDTYSYTAGKTNEQVMAEDKGWPTYLLQPVNTIEFNQFIKTGEFRY